MSFSTVPQRTRACLRTASQIYLANNGRNCVTTLKRLAQQPACVPTNLAQERGVKLRAFYMTLVSVRPSGKPTCWVGLRLNIPPLAQKSPSKNTN